MSVKVVEEAARGAVMMIAAVNPFHSLVVGSEFCVILILKMSAGGLWV